MSRKQTYGEILKSSAIIAGSSVINVGFGIIRVKAMAIFLGPAGIGLMGLYTAIADLALSLAGMGINNSGVRQIAEATGSGEANRIACTVAVLKRGSIVLGLIGGLLLVVFSNQVSSLTFGNHREATGIALLSLAVLFRLVAAGQGALLQGMRRITDLAKMDIVGGLLGTIISIPVIYYFREDGVVASLIGVALMTLLTSWWFSRKVKIPVFSPGMSEMATETVALLKLGFAFMACSLLTVGAAYVIRIIVLHRIGFEGAGLDQSAWALGGMYVGFILQAMGTDFYPRLTAVAKDNKECNLLVNEQAQISLLLAGPGVIATLTFAPLVIAVFYSAQFHAAVEILRWICLGMTLRVVSWPMGMIVIAKGAQSVFFWTEVAAAIVHIGLGWLCIAIFGLPGAGMAFFGLYVWHGVFIYLIVRKMSGFRWSAMNMRTGMLFLPLTGLVFCGFYLWPFWLAITVGVTATFLSGVYSARELLHLVPGERIPRPIRGMLISLRMAPPVAA